VTKVLPPVNVLLQKTKTAKPFLTHIDKVKPYHGDAPRSWLPITSVEPQSTGPAEKAVAVSEVEPTDSVIEAGNSREKRPRRVKPSTQQPVVSEEAAIQVYDADEAAQPRPMREKQLPARYRDD